ncbi:MAG: ATP-binding protein, partial [Nanoarchaeota archaeon]|nr:ATP-binding protein [Nanoarchaeota archaeon]
MYIKRELEEIIKKYLKHKEIIAVIGTRQCGKTTLVKHILKDIKKVNQITFEDIKTKNLFETDIDSFIELHIKEYDYLFIDEVQYSKDNGQKLKYIYDTSNIKIIISGSSSPDLSIHSLKYLVGRIFIFELYPFSFKEFLSYKNPELISIFNKKKYGTEILSQLNKYLEEFLSYGGYPAVVLTESKESKKLILKNIFNTYILREIKEILELSENDKLVLLLKSFSLQIGNLINYTELSNITGFDFNTLKKYIKILEDTFICMRCLPFYTNKRTEIIKSPKIYFLDYGFRNICIDNFSKERTDKGQIYENLI